MSRYIPGTVGGSKTYATEERAVKRAEEIIAGLGDWIGPKMTYIIMIADNGRYVPVFIGERAVQTGIHFKTHVLA